jgi:hypothetical protein
MRVCPLARATRLVLAVVIAWNPTTLLAADANARFSKPVKTPALDGEELVAIQLDSDVYEASADGFSDLRLFDPRGDEIPYVLRKATTKEHRTERRWFRVANPAVRPQDDGSLEITFELDDELPARPLGFRLVTPLENFERRITAAVSTGDVSTGNSEWEPLVDDGLVFDYSRFMDVRNIELPLPPTGDGKTSGRRYRLTVADVTQEQQSQLMELTRTLNDGDETSRSERIVVNRQPFRIDRIEGWYDIEVAGAVRDQLAEYAVSGFATTRDVETKATIVTFALRREPVTSFTVETDDRNFRRAARVQAQGESSPRAATSGESEVMRDVGSGTLERLDFGGLHREDLTLALPEAREVKYRLIVENDDSKPLDLTGVVAKGPVYEAVFLAQPGEDYTFEYGGDLASPRYDTAALAASIAAGYDAVAAELGAPTPVASPPPPAELALAAALNDPLLLGGIIALLVIVLGVGLYRATRRLDGFPGDDGQPS